MTLFLNQTKERITSMQKLLVTLTLVFVFAAFGIAQGQQEPAVKQAQKVKNVPAKVIKNEVPGQVKKTATTIPDTIKAMKQKEVEQNKAKMHKQIEQTEATTTKHPPLAVKKGLKKLHKKSDLPKDAEKKQGDKK
jgi:hypothetical protein